MTTNNETPLGVESPAPSVALPPIPDPDFIDSFAKLYLRHKVERYGLACAKAVADVKDATIADLRAELDVVLADWNLMVAAVGSPTNGGAVGHARAMRLERDTLQQRVGELEAALVLPSGPWRNWWQGSGPERGDHIMSADGRITYLPAPDGTTGSHDQSGEIVYAHNTALSAMAAEQDSLRRQLEAKETEVEALRAGIEKALVEIDDAGPKALKYARQELDAAIDAARSPRPTAGADQPQAGGESNG